MAVLFFGSTFTRALAFEVVYQHENLRLIIYAVYLSYVGWSGILCCDIQQRGS
jgi:hypothetical protein